MRFIQNNNTDPFFNLALEEYLLKDVSFESFVLWSSQPSIVVGKHQNALAEVNFDYVYENDITVARRLSGGGTVFHGPGNLNFTFIRNGEPGRLIDFRKHTAPVIDFLNSLGVPARFEGKNDLRVHGLKISGNAEHVYKNRVLHHGTLLFDADLASLADAIRIMPGRYIDKSVQSVRSRVANIVDFLPEPLSFDEFRNMLASWLKDYFAREDDHDGQIRESAAYQLSEGEKEFVRQLANEKYSRWEWIYGYSPDYAFTGAASVNENDLSLWIKVKKGVICDASIICSKPDSRWTNLATSLPGKQHSVEGVLDLLKMYDIADQNTKRFPMALIPLFF